MATVDTYDSLASLMVPQQRRIRCAAMRWDPFIPFLDLTRLILEAIAQDYENTGAYHQDYDSLAEGGVLAEGSAPGNSQLFVKGVVRYEAHNYCNAYFQVFGIMGKSESDFGTFLATPSCS